MCLVGHVSGWSRAWLVTCLVGHVCRLCARRCLLGAPPALRLALRRSSTASRPRPLSPLPRASPARSPPHTQQPARICTGHACDRVIV
eukprot:5477634-Prymnesium_polylepis.1